MLDQITPVILTFNEDMNIERVLARLIWAKSVIIVDSFSTDHTSEIISRYPAVRFFQRVFDSHADQWNYAMQHTGIETDWVLALDADYVLTSPLITELAGLKPDASVFGYRASFRYCIFGRPLRGSLYPPVTVLFRKKNATYMQDGHTQRIVVQNGDIGQLGGEILHDDRKSLSSWLQAQDHYMNLEAKVIHTARWSALSLPDKIRKMIIVAPAITFVYSFIFKQGVLDGWAGVYYALQRTLAELILSLKLIQLHVTKDG
jgi:glycosyltransferase involved in cell wall biosynthesis